MTACVNATQHGYLYLVPTPLDFGCSDIASIESMLPMHTLTIAANLSHWITENAKSTRHFLNRVHAVVPLQRPLQDHTITLLPRQAHKKGDHTHSTHNDLAMQALLNPCLSGHSVGLVSEAGMPTIADPGSSVVRAAHTMGIKVIPLVGPVSLMMGLASSGLNGQNFAFVGYLPIASDERDAKIAQLQAISQKTGQTQIVIETPYRNRTLLESLVAQLPPTMRLAVLCGASLESESAYSALVHQWRKQTPLLPLDLPTVFMFGKG